MAGNARAWTNRVRLADRQGGLPRRLSYAKEIFEGGSVFPKPLEYEDIDKEFQKFADEMIPLSFNGKKVPTYTLYSSQRFSEYSQSWNHTDEDGNVLMNFKATSRENNPKTGTHHGGLWNIPGRRRYTLLMRTAMEDDGQECYEVYSMEQPYTVDLVYKVSFVTNLFENLNAFNGILNRLFKARQCYMRPNGHYIPMLLDDVSDETQYNIENIKFYVQTATIRAMAYIIPKESFHVERTPKKAKMFMEGENPLVRPKLSVSVDEYFNDSIRNKAVEITATLEAWHSKIVFDMDKEVVITETSTDNVRTMRMFLGGTPTYWEKGFRIKENDEVKLRINAIDSSKPCTVTFIGYDPNYEYADGEVSEDASDNPEKFDTYIIQ